MTADNVHLESRPSLCERDVWVWLESGCNANEIAAYAHISIATAYAMMARASRLFSNPVRQGSGQDQH